MSGRSWILIAFAMLATAPCGVGIAGADAPREDRTLTELWSISEFDEEPVLGMITRVLGDESGTVYLLDTKQHVAHVMAADGEYLGTVGREGDGPGEVREPRDLLLLPDGAVGLLKRMPGSVVQVDRRGDPIGTRTVADDAGGGFTLLQQAAFGGENLVVLGRHSRPGEGQTEWEYFLAPVLADDSLGPHYTSATATMDFSRPAYVERDHYVRLFMPWCVGPDGRVYVADDRDRYAIRVLAAQGGQERVIEAAFDVPDRSGHVADNLRAAVESCVRGRGAEVEMVVEKKAPAVTSLRVDELGSLWVRHARSLERAAGESVLTYDVYGSDGDLVRRVALHGAAVGELDGMYLLPGDLAVLVREHRFCRLVIDCQGAGESAVESDEGDDLPMVTCFRIE